jgi:hypothetical protein
VLPELSLSHTNQQYPVAVNALLALLDEVPRELIDLPSVEYLEFTRCRAVLATSLVRWNLGDIARPET